MARLGAADVAECPEADQPGHDQVDGDEVIEKARKNQDENPYDNRQDRRKMSAHRHGHGPMLLGGCYVLCRKYITSRSGQAYP